MYAFLYKLRLNVRRFLYIFLVLQLLFVILVICSFHEVFYAGLFCIKYFNALKGLYDSISLDFVFFILLILFMLFAFVFSVEDLKLLVLFSILSFFICFIFVYSVISFEFNQDSYLLCDCYFFTVEKVLVGDEKVNIFWTVYREYVEQALFPKVSYDVDIEPLVREVNDPAQVEKIIRDFLESRVACERTWSWKLYFYTKKVVNYILKIFFK